MIRRQGIKQGLLEQPLFVLSPASNMAMNESYLPLSELKIEALRWEKEKMAIHK